MSACEKGPDCCHCSSSFTHTHRPAHQPQAFRYKEGLVTFLKTGRDVFRLFECSAYVEDGLLSLVLRLRRKGERELLEGRKKDALQGSGILCLRSSYRW